VITLHEGGRHTGVSLMHDAGVREEITMREAGHADRGVHARYTHVLDEAHRTAVELVARAGENLMIAHASSSASSNPTATRTVDQLHEDGRLPRSGRVRRQGLEPRTRGLRARPA